MTSDDPFDLDNLALPKAAVRTAPRAPRSQLRPRTGEPFLKGPIPWRWLEAAARRPGQALHAGLALWFEAGCKKRRTVRVTCARLARLGLSRSTAHRARRQLAKAGLIAMAARPGRANEITILGGPVPGVTATNPQLQPGPAA